MSFAESGLLEWDLELLSVVYSTRNDALTLAMTWLDALVAPTVVMSALLLIGAHALKREWPCLGTLLAMMAGGAILGQSLKVLVSRSRPTAEALVSTSGFSFPSAQALAVTLLAGWAVHVAWAALANAGRCVAVAAASIAVLTVAYGRVYLGAHYPSDAVAGALIGAFWLCVCLEIHQRATR